MQTQKIVPLRNPDNLPPQNLDSEQALLGAILISQLQKDEEVLAEVIENLSPDDFYSTAHRIIYQSILFLYQGDQPIDLVTLHAHLESKGLIEKAGGPTYLIDLMSSVPITENAVHYALIVKNKSRERGLLKASQDITRMCLHGTKGTDELMDWAQQVVFDAAEKEDRSESGMIGKILPDTLQSINDRVASQELSGIASGFTELDTLTDGFQSGDLILLAARPSMGKTALALNIARNAAGNGIPVAVFSMEMEKEKLVERLLAAEAEVNMYRLKKGEYMTGDPIERLENAARRLDGLPIYIDDSSSNTPLDIKAGARRIRRTYGLGLVIVDYLQLMKGGMPFERRDLEVGDISRGLKAIAKDLKVPLIALSQLNRKLEERIDKRPMLADLRESGSLEQDADTVLFLYRDEVYNREDTNPLKDTAELIIGKQRNGPLGTVKFNWLSGYMKFQDFQNGGIPW